MFLKLIIISAMILAASATTPSHRRRFPGCVHRDYHPGKSTEDTPSTLFENLARDLKAVDDKVQNACDKYGNALTREVFEADRYTVVSPVPGFSEDDFKIKINGRAMLISATSSSGVKYTEVRTLPTFVEASQAVYTYDGERLRVAAPAGAGACGPALRHDLLLVPKFRLDAAPGFGPRSGFGT